MSKAVNLSSTIKEFEKKSGWIAIDKENNIVFWAKDFSDLMEKVKDEDLTALPLARDYSGLVT